MPVLRCVWVWWCAVVWLHRGGKGGLATLIRRSAVGQCDGKSLLHISMRPEGRQPVQIGSRIKITQGQVQGLLR